MPLHAQFPAMDGHTILLILIQFCSLFPMPILAFNPPHQTMANRQKNISSMPFPMAKHSIPVDSPAQPFKLAILELASELLANANTVNPNGQKQKEKEGEEEERNGLIQRRSSFFGEGGGWPAPMAPASGDGPGTASFSRQPKTRDQQESDLEDELRAEFVRVSLKNDPDPTVRFRKKTYTTIPPFECYSCMSSSYQTKWGYLKEMYIAPKMFTDACDEPIHRRSPIPTVLCASFCISMLEPSVEAVFGVFVGFKYIRGCGDRILRHGFNHTALQIHRFAQVDKCRQLPRAHLFNQPRQLEVAVTGNLQLCTCYGERCNGSSSAARLIAIMGPFSQFVFTLIAALLHIWLMSIQRDSIV